MNDKGKNAAKDSERLRNGCPHFAFVICITAENKRPPWAMDDHKRKFIR